VAFLGLVYYKSLEAVGNRLTLVESIDDLGGSISDMRRAEKNYILLHTADDLEANRRALSRLEQTLVASREQWVDSVCISGGEPTLREDLLEIISVMDPENTLFAMVTNSLKLDAEYLAKLKQAGVGTVHFSLDSSRAEVNDRMRGGPGHFKKVIESISEAKELNFAVYISTVIMHNGLGKMEEMASFAQKYGIGIVFSLACVSGNWSEQKDVLLSRNEWIKVQEFMKQHPFIRSDWTINFSMRQECPGGREKINISPYGDVMGCGMNYISFGNVREEPLERIWKRMCNFPEFKRRSPDCLIGADTVYIDKYIRPISGMSVPVRIDKHPANPRTLE